MPSTSPGHPPPPTTPSSFPQVLPGAPTSSLQSIDSFIFRHKRYIVYISGRQVNLLSSPTTLVQALRFNDSLIAVAAETRTGKIAVASEKEAWILEPLTEGWTKVWWEKTLFLRREDAGDEARCLSWGNEGEILVGGSRQLSMFSTPPPSRTSSPAEDGKNVEVRRALWSKNVASPVQYATFSSSGNLIATCGKYDRLVKIWRRLSFEEGLFDYTYLPHPGTVTHLEWKPAEESSEDLEEGEMSARHDDDAEILYTIANDGLLRIWRNGGLHDLDILLLHTTVDLSSAIPQSPSMTVKGEPHNKPARYTFVLSSSQFYEAITAAIENRTQKLSHALEHLREMSSKEPEVIVALDGHGRMSAWGLQSIGHKRRPDTPSGLSKQAFHIAHAEDLPLRIEQGVNARFIAWFEGSKFNVLVHSFVGYVQWWRSDVDTFFSPSAAGSGLLDEAAYWSSHIDAPIASLKSSGEDRDLISCTLDGEIANWTAGGPAGLHNGSVYRCGKVLDLALLSMGDGADANTVVLERASDDSCKVKISLRNSSGRELDSQDHTLDGSDDTSKWCLYQAESNDVRRRVVALSNVGKAFCFTIDSSKGAAIQNLQKLSVPESSNDDSLIHCAAVLDASDSDRIGIVCITQSGSLLLYHSEDAENEASDPMLMATFGSGVEDASMLAVSNDLAGIASFDGKELAIVNLRDGYVEYRCTMGGHIRCIVPSKKDNLLAVGYDASVDVLAQGRYEHHREMSTWILLKQISITGIGLEMSAMTWLGDGSLALAAGNGIFVSSNDVPVEELHKDVREAIGVDAKTDAPQQFSVLSQHLKKPLPVWHPILVSHTVRQGHWNLAAILISTLARKLKFWSEGDDLHPLLDIPAEQLYNTNSVDEASGLDKDLVKDLMQELEERDLPEVSQSEQERLKRVVEAMSYCSEHVKGLDNDALRFLFSWKLELLHVSATSPPTEQPNGLSSQPVSAVPEMHWREISFAYQSTTQQALLDILIAHYDNKITWDIARHLGLFAWLSDRQALEQIFEALAQSAYRTTSPPDPINASLYFLALHKKPTLLALWRIATWHKEQRNTMNFLRRDFTQTNNQTAAKKNAYALMGKKRFDYAAAFFLLAEDAGSATSVLASQCEDIMLAIAVARLYSGDGSPVLRQLLEDRLMPQATQDGNRWLTSWCHSILFERDHAAEALVQPLEGVRSWQQHDPDTLTLYRQLRKSESEYEYDAILRAARILRRMGLWLQALELMSQWEFAPTQLHPSAGHVSAKVTTNGVHGAQEAPSMLDSTTDTAPAAPASMLDDFTSAPAPAKEPPSMLDGFTSSEPPAAPVEDEKAAREAKAAELLKKMKAKKEEPSTPAISEKKKEPTQFKEPDANSLLDNFGF